MVAVVEHLARSLAENSCAVHGPVAADAVGALVAERAVALGRGPVALHDDDHLAAMGVEAALVSAGVEVLGPAASRDRLAAAAVGITGSTLAVAEQGMLALSCSPAKPRATSLLPRAHLAVVRAEVVVATFPEAMERIAAAPLPSAITWVGGPSRTGDLEMITTLGVHGPTTVEVVLVAAPH